ncbi:MAG: DUF1211 domain-containing protein [Methanobacterium sp.]|uniref:TMEM175 family protein n=1 Tax=Methanobacterium sp. TaxID=2164 RepID=UPI003D65E335|nr:DUF1211 domain-containing protein [Methanobacterium sp.]
MEYPGRDLATISIENLTIGVFAIVMTLLVLDIKVPYVPANEILGTLFTLWPNFFAYAISFALLGIYLWVILLNSSILKKLIRILTG